MMLFMQAPHTKSEPTALVNMVNAGFWWCAATVVLAASFFLFNLGGEAFFDYDEATYARVTVETQQSSDLMTLRLLDRPWFEKPPLYFWLSMFFAEIFPTPEFAYRFSSALAGIGSIILVMLIAYHLTRRYPVACVSGLVLLFSPPFYEAARQMRLDVPVTLTILIAFYAFLKGLERPRWMLGIGLSLAVGVMFKSIIAGLAAPIILIWALVHRNFSWLKMPQLWIGAFLGAAIVAPWHVYETMQHGATFWASYLGEHVVNRFDSNILKGASTGSNMTYVSYLLQFALPWTVVFVAGLVPLAAQRDKEESRPLIGLAAAALFILGIFLIAGTKISYYLTPMYPFIAMFIAIAGFAFYERIRGEAYVVGFHFIALIVVGIAIANTIFVGFHHQHQLAYNYAGAEAERTIGRIVAAAPADLAIYTYEWPYWETLRYYSGGRRITGIEDDQILDRPFFLVIPSVIYAKNPFDPELQSHFTMSTSTDILTLLMFTP
ncbi:MAG: glycosyltransferase family 39 protein [Candidatus Pacebacteria bacterium]|nr:glycosyltransferase family 39 protein [Candidatus Paceibacterota bacterium]